MITNNFTYELPPRPEYWVCHCGHRVTDSTYMAASFDYPCPGCNPNIGKEYWPWRMLSNYKAVYAEKKNAETN